MDLLKQLVCCAAASVATKIRSLRSEFGKHMRDENLPSGSAAGKKKKWRFFNQMLFLKDIIVPRVTTSNLDFQVDSRSFANDNRHIEDETYDAGEQDGNQVFDDDRASDELQQPPNAAATAIGADNDFFQNASVPDFTPRATGNMHQTSTPRESNSSNKKRRFEDDSAAAIRSVSTVMSAVCQKLQQKSVEKSATNSTRVFCELMYHQLMSIPNEDNREMLQLELHSMIMRFKQRRPHNRSSNTSRMAVSHSYGSAAAFHNINEQREPEGACNSSFVSMLTSATSTLHDNYEEDDNRFSSFCQSNDYINL